MLRTSSLLVLVLAGCPNYPRRPASPKPMTTPMAIVDLNSAYDDFNAADMSRVNTHDVVFSTNRGSEGHDFDLYQARIWWKRDETRSGPTPFSAQPPEPFAPQLMSDGNERGPILVDKELTHDWGYWTLLVFASDRAGGLGGLDLYASECHDYTNHEVPCAKATDVHPLTALSSAADDAYLSRPFDDHQVLFASNRDGSAQMDIYSARWARDKTLDDSPAAIARVAALSSDADDTAPYVYGRERNATQLVFVSARPGGLGEHDIYCSRFVSGQWTSPVNLGAAINSPRDEYRPIVIEVNGTRFLVFSSTREGGQGGYDLYVVGYRGCPG